MTTCAKCGLEIPDGELVKCPDCGKELHKKGCSREYGPERLRYCFKCHRKLKEDNPSWVGMQ